MRLFRACKTIVILACRVGFPLCIKIQADRVNEHRSSGKNDVHDFFTSYFPICYRFAKLSA